MTTISRASRVLGLIVAASGLLSACATAPETATARRNLKDEAQRTLTMMTARDPSLQPLIDRSAGYVVFPSISQGGAVVGGASGRGVVYQQGRPIGYASLSQVSIGAQLGGQTFSELVVLKDRAALSRLKGGTLDVGGQSSAVMIRSGSAAAAPFGREGFAVFVQPRGGAMFNLSLTGQRIRFAS